MARMSAAPETHAAEDVHVHSVALAAISELAVDDHRRDATDAVTFRICGDGGILHVPDHHVAVLARRRTNGLNRVVAARAACAEDLHRSHDRSLLNRSWTRGPHGCFRAQRSP